MHSDTGSDQLNSLISIIQQSFWVYLLFGFHLRFSWWEMISNSRSLQKVPRVFKIEIYNWTASLFSFLQANNNRSLRTRSFANGSPGRLDKISLTTGGWLQQSLQWKSLSASWGLQQTLWLHGLVTVSVSSSVFRSVLTKIKFQTFKFDPFHFSNLRWLSCDYREKIKIAKFG